MDCKIDLSAFVIDRDDMERVQLDMKSRTYFDAIERVAAINEKNAEQVVIVAQQARIAELEKALEPFADLVTAWSGHSEGLIDQLVLVNREDARRAAALLKEDKK